MPSEIKKKRATKKETIERELEREKKPENRQPLATLNLSPVQCLHDSNNSQNYNLLT